jgi:hypothetical protein
MFKDTHRNASTILACGMAREILLTFGEVRLCVFGTSMVPSLLPGDLISIRRSGLQEISPGEVVLFSRKERLFVHRVVDRIDWHNSEGLAEPCLITRGDRLGHDDPPVSSFDLLGRVVSVERGNRKVELAARTGGSSHWIVPLLRTSDRATYLYLHLVACRRAFSLGRTRCRV